MQTTLYLPGHNSWKFLETILETTLEIILETILETILQTTLQTILQTISDAKKRFRYNRPTNHARTFRATHVNMITLASN
jgi:hypothetical protein